MTETVQIPSGTVTLLFTDIEGSTRLWESEPDAMAQALRRHDDMLRRAIKQAGGYVFKTVGDAFCAAFADADSALCAVLAAQLALVTEAWPTSRPMRVRMSLHTGICEERDGDYFGPVVNRAARLEAVAHGGQVLISGATAELLAGRLPDGVSLIDLGQHRLKDLGRPEHVLQLGASFLKADFPPLSSLDNPELPNNLPCVVSAFIGRACSHARESGRYHPPRSLCHLVQIRQRTCSYPGCRRAAVRCEIDHTIPFDQGGRTCECNLAPACRRHHRAKQAPGWQLSQDQPGHMTWQLPHERTYATIGEPYPV